MRLWASFCCAETETFWLANPDMTSWEDCRHGIAGLGPAGDRDSRESGPPPHALGVQPIPPVLPPTGINPFYQ